MRLSFSVSFWATVHIFFLNKGAETMSRISTKSDRQESILLLSMQQEIFGFSSDNFSVVELCYNFSKYSSFSSLFQTNLLLAYSKSSDKIERKVDQTVIRQYIGLLHFKFFYKIKQILGTNTIIYNAASPMPNKSISASSAVITHPTIHYS